MSKHVAVLMGGWSAEREVSLTSGAGVADALESRGHRVTRIDMGRNVATHLAEAKPDVVFNALHGTPGEDGTVETWPRDRFGYSYRHSAVPEGAIVVEALFEGVPGERAAIGAEMDRIAAEREASQPLRSRTGGSTFKNPPGTKAWKLIDAAGCRGLRIGDAQVSEKHCNFLLNLGNAAAADIEALGEEVRRRVREHSGVMLEWEIQRVGVWG